VLKRIVVSLAIVAVACLSVACERGSRPGPNVWAVVNGQPILRQQVDRYYRSEFNRRQQPSPEEAQLLKLNILDELINNQLLLQQARKLGLEASDSEVEKKFAELKAPYSEQEFQHQLAARGITADELRNELRERLSIQKLINREITSKINVTEQEIAAAYNRNRAAYDVAEPEYHVAQIVVTTHPNPNVRNRKNSDATTPAQALQKIRMLLEKLRSGANFAQLAEDYSEDPMTAASGGDLGFISESALDQGQPALKRAVMALKPGQISGIIHVKGSYRIIKLIARISPGERELSDPQVQQSIREALEERKEQLLRSAYLAELRDKAHVTNYLAREILASDGNLPSQKTAPSDASPNAPSPASSSAPANGHPPPPQNPARLSAHQ
jgi:peptidyl-prolyl cis-trans isomerase SurA